MRELFYLLLDIDEIDRYIAEGYKYSEIVNNKIVGLDVCRATVDKNRRRENSRITAKQNIKMLK